MGKKVSIFCFLLIFFLSGNALAVSFQYAGIFSEHRKYSDDFGGAEWNNILAFVTVDDYAKQAGDYAQVTWFGGTDNLPYHGDDFLGMDIFGKGLSATHPDFAGKTYFFELKDQGNNLILSSSWVVPADPYPFTTLSIPYITTVDAGGKYFEWEPVPEAEYYIFAVAPLNESGQPAIQDTILISEKLYEAKYTFTYNGPPGDYAFWIQARQDNPEGNMPANFINRSSYIFKYTMPNRALNSLPILLLSGDD